MTEMINLNVGAGKDIRQGWINYDTHNVNGARIHKLPDALPHSPNSVDKIYCSHVLEDFSSETQRNIIKDFNRVLKPGGILHLLMPHFRNPEFFSSGYHTRPASKGSLNWSVEKESNYGKPKLFSKMIKCKINFWSRPGKRNKIYYTYGWLLEPLVNINTTTQYVYEMFIGSIFPCHEVEWIIKK